MIARTLIIHLIINIFLITRTTTKLKKHGPNGLEENETTTCDEFSQYARFNPYSVIKDKWMVFYYWGPPQNIHVYKFYVPGQEENAYLRKLLDGNVPEPINWTAKLVLMKERSNNTCLLVERNARGEYDGYELFRYKKGEILKPVDIRIKQTGDNRYIGLMACNTEIVVVMARVNDIPRKKVIQDVAARMGYRSRGGKSYLYQGHQWMPIPEADERVYWRRPRLKEW